MDLRARTAAMLPRVDLPDVILEAMEWAPELAASFTPGFRRPVQANGQVSGEAAAAGNRPPR